MMMAYHRDGGDYRCATGRLPVLLAYHPAIITLFALGNSDTSLSMWQYWLP